MTTSRFVHEVQASRVLHPTQLGFSTAGWHRAFESAADHSVEARRLSDAGLWTFSQLELVRSQIGAANARQTRTDEAIRLLVGLTNYVTHQAAASVIQNLADELLCRGRYNQPGGRHP